MKPTLTERDNLVKALIAARAMAGVSVRRVARRANLSTPAVQQIETGRNFPSARVLRSYALLCGIDSDDLLLAWGYMPEDAFRRIQKNPQLLSVVRSF